MDSSNSFPILVEDSQYTPSIDFIRTKSSNYSPILVGKTQHTPTHIRIERSNHLPFIIDNLKLLCLDDIRNTLKTRCRKQSSNNNQTKHSEEHSLECSDLITEFVDFVLH